MGQSLASLGSGSTTPCRTSCATSTPSNRSWNELLGDATSRWSLRTEARDRHTIARANWARGANLAHSSSNDSLLNRCSVLGSE